jgi:hypothetical protein
MKYHAGDQIIHVEDESYDILTVLRDCGGEVECFEYNPRDVIVFEKREVEPL